MKKLRMTLALLLVALLCAACGGNTAQEEDNQVSEMPQDVALTGTYTAYVSGYDWGAAVDKVVLQLSAPVDSASGPVFVVTETKSATDYTQEDTPVVEQTFERGVTDAYTSDASGNRASGASSYVTLELNASPSEGSPINYDPVTGQNTWCDPYTLDITALPGLFSNGALVSSLTVDPMPVNMVTDVDFLSLDTFTATDGITYEYAYYIPDGGSDTLVVWLHGGGEGGTAADVPKTDPRIVMLANEAANLAKADFQAKVGGANVLIPQCPTMWMDEDGSGVYPGDAARGTSFYTESLKELIDACAETTGSTKVILTGCSNGGFMSLLMALTYPDAYDGIVPICEALPDRVISDSALRAIRDLPMFFIWSDDDDTVVPENHEIPTTARLEAMGASNLHVSTTEHVTDTSGLYKDEEGNPYQYMGHWSWIYFDNDEAVCNSHDGETAWDFIANIVAPVEAAEVDETEEASGEETSDVETAEADAGEEDAQDAEAAENTEEAAEG